MYLRLLSAGFVLLFQAWKEQVSLDFALTLARACHSFRLTWLFCPYLLHFAVKRSVSAWTSESVSSETPSSHPSETPKNGGKEQCRFLSF